LLAGVIEQLAGVRLELIKRLKSVISNWDVKPIHASMFGSAARGDGNTKSDIDIFLVRPKDVDDEDPAWRDQIDRLSDQVLAWTGNRAGVIDVGETDIAAFLEEKRPLLGNISEDAIDLVGKPARRLLRKGA
jgi:predicted nucleotidyltransferase